jgi:acetyl esterase/lipase
MILVLFSPAFSIWHCHAISSNQKKDVIEMSRNNTTNGTLLTRRDMLALSCAVGAAVILRAEGMSQTSSAPQPSTPDTDPLSYVNSELRPALKTLLSEGPFPELNATTLSLTRKMSAEWGRPLLPQPAITTRLIPGHSGSPEVRVYVVGASPGSSKPAVLHIHGGGYVSGTVTADRRNLQDLVIAQDCVAVSVDYRLAPETRFPGSLEDNYAALRWLYTNAKELGVDRKRIAIKGESAGGGHAAALAIAARDRGEIPICMQVLIYPMLDDRTGSTRHVPPYLGHYIWTEDKNRFGWSSLLGVPAGSQDVPKGSVPARVAGLNGLPPTFIGVGSIDLFAPEDLEYAQRLVLAGVPTEVKVVPGAFHGFDVIAPDVALSRHFNNAWNEALKRVFANS